VWDYGPLGVELKNNVKRAWWRSMVQLRDDIVGLDSGILMHPQIWVTSGHVENFTDPLVECQTDQRRFHLMLKTFLGPVEDDAAVVWLRPETAQGIYVNFKNVRETSRKKLPFG